jgi:hypothetical protein
MKYLSIAYVLVAGCLIDGHASARDKATPDKKDPQSIYEPRSIPGAGQKFLEKFVGDWAVAKTFYPRTGDPVRQNGECRQTMIHEGRFLRSEYRATTKRPVKA